MNKLLEDGNILYRKNRLQEAAHRYQYALRKLPSNVSHGEYSGTFLQLKVNFLLNHSRCKRKMNVSFFYKFFTKFCKIANNFFVSQEFAEAIDLATEAIELHPETYEGYYSRSKAQFEQRNMTEATVDIQKALQRSDPAHIDVRRVLLRLQDEINHRKKLNANGQMYGTNSSDTSTDL